MPYTPEQYNEAWTYEELGIIYVQLYDEHIVLENVIGRIRNPRLSTLFGHARDIYNQMRARQQLEDRIRRLEQRNDTPSGPPDQRLQIANDELHVRLQAARDRNTQLQRQFDDDRLTLQQVQAALDAEQQKTSHHSSATTNDGRNEQLQEENERPRARNEELERDTAETRVTVQAVLENPRDHDSVVSLYQTKVTYLQQTNDELVQEKRDLNARMTAETDEHEQNMEYYQTQLGDRDYQINNLITDRDMAQGEADNWRELEETKKHRGNGKCEKECERLETENMELAIQITKLMDQLPGC
jgi:hypothetical protein